MRCRLLLLCFALEAPALTACGGEWDVPRGREASSARVSLEPFGGTEPAPAVVRLRVTGGASRGKLEEFRVFESELSQYHLGRIAARELPKTLLERVIPAVAWVDGADVVVAPTAPLDSGLYALASPELGLLSDFTVDATLVPWLERRWPPPELAVGNGAQIFCGAASGVTASAVLLAPANTEAELTLGFAPGGSFADECVTLSPSEPLLQGTLVLPPPLAGDVALEPRPLFGSEAGTPPFACAEDERALGPACARVEDDRIRLRSGGAASLWVTERPEARWFVIGAGASAVVRGFQSGRAGELRARAFDVSGAAWEIDESVTGLPPRPRVVINEVLANPSGAEASGEWIELVNDGQHAAELSEFELLDSGGAVALPAHRLAPGEFALLVGPRYEPDPELELIPDPGTLVLRMTALGNAGLSNSGELLRLQHRSGVEVSRVPPIRAAKSGFSLARRTPDAGDTASDFAVHAAPGASPGAPNQISEGDTR